MDKAKLIGLLARWVAAGKLEARYVLPAIQELSGDDIDPSLSLWRVLETMGGLGEGGVPEPLAALTRHLRETLRQEATRAFQQRRLGNPLPEQTRALLDGLDLEPAMEWKLDGEPIRSVELASRRRVTSLSRVATRPRHRNYFKPSKRGPWNAGRPQPSRSSPRRNGLPPFSSNNSNKLGHRIVPAARNCLARCGRGGRPPGKHRLCEPHAV
jgi:hypothetical protein